MIPASGSATATHKFAVCGIDRAPLVPVDTAGDVYSPPVGSLWRPQVSEAVDHVGGGAEEIIDVKRGDTDRRAVLRVNVTRRRVSVNA